MATCSTPKEAGKRHNVNFSNDLVQNGYPFGWWTTYNQRALLVRILCDAKKKGQNLKPDRIEKVKFFTKEQISNKKEAPSFNWDSYELYNLKDLYRFMEEHLETFELPELEGQHWEHVMHWKELLDFRYAKIGKEEFWASNELMTKDMEEYYDKLSVEQKIYMSTFGGALKSNMTNGQAKRWIVKLIQTIIETTDQLEKRDVEVWAPCNNDDTSTMVETISGKLDDPFIHLQYNEPYSYSNKSLVASSSSVAVDLSQVSLEASSVISDASRSSLNGTCITRSEVVPDVIAGLMQSPGMFPLVFEFKQREPKGFNQNICHMLSKMFFQDVIFGVVVSPKSYRLSVMIKNQGNLLFAHTESIHLTSYENKMFKLDLTNLNDLCTFIYRVLIWSKKSKCLTDVQDTRSRTEVR